MTEQEAKELMAKIQGWARKRPFRSEQDREDFVSFAVTKVLKGRSASFGQLRVDWMREFVAGRSDGAHFAERLEMAQGSITAEAVDVVPDHEPNALNVLERSEMIRRALDVKGPDRAILLLRGLFSFSEKEIAFIFGVTEARISQKLSKAQRLRRFFLDYENGDDFPLAL